MARLLITATYGHDNAPRATMPFYVAKGAKEAGLEPVLVLALDAIVPGAARRDRRRRSARRRFPRVTGR